MPTYVILGHWSDQGIRNIKGQPQRTDQTIQAIEAAGGKMIGLWTTMGRYDFVMVVEGPSDEQTLGQLLAVASQGNIRTETLKAFPREVVRPIIERLP